MINDYWIVHRIPVNFSGASTYSKLSRIMILCCCTHISSIQCNDRYTILECDALYDLKRQLYHESVPFQLYQQGIDILFLEGVVTRRYVHQTLGLEIHSYTLLLYWNID